ncbi:mechanosensitive channel MscK [Plesiomonas sp.]|uniref:mechanosensitive channel MscK n=1 Tax=Plesiomonas sp. TaxID=2486279 RepID=UPI003F2FD1A6
MAPISCVFSRVNRASWLSLLLLASLLCGGRVTAASNFSSASFELPQVEELQTQLDGLAKKDKLSPTQATQKTELEQTISFLDSIDKEKSKIREIQQQYDKAPAQLQQLQDQLSSLRDGLDEAALNKEFERLGLSELERKLNNTQSNTQKAQEQLSAVSSQLISMQTLPERAQAAMSKAYVRMQDVRNTLNGVSADQDGLTAGRKLLLNTEVALLNVQIERRQKELDSNTTLQDIAQKQRDIFTEQLNQYEQLSQLLQQKINQNNLTQSEKTVTDVSGSEQNSVQDLNPLVVKELEKNQQISQNLINATQQVNTMVQENTKVKNWLDSVTQTERNLNEQISVLKGSLLLSRILYQQRQMLPDADLARNLEERIADLRLEQFEVNRQRDELYQPNQYVDQLVSQNGNKPLSEPVHKALIQVLDARKELLDQFNKQLGNQLNMSINLQLNQQQLQRVSNSLQNTLQQQIFWVTSNKPLDWAWIWALPAAIFYQAQEIINDVHLANWAGQELKLLFIIVPLLMLAGLIIWRRKDLSKHLQSIESDIGQLRRDSQLHTLRALLLTMLQVLPGTLFVVSFGMLFIFSNLSSPTIIWHLTLRFALAYQAFGMLARVLQPGGIAETHFNRQESEINHLRRSLHYIALAVAPLILVSTVGELEPSSLANDAIGQVITLSMLIVMVFLIYPISRSRIDENGNSLLRLFVMFAIMLAPVALIALVVLGYYYTSLKLTAKLIDSFYLVMLWWVVHETALRGLAVAARRLAYRRAMARRQQKAHENAEGGEIIDEQPMALEQINQQSLRLSNMLLFLVFLGAFYWLWSDLVTVISYLDSVTLWVNTNVADGITHAVTLRDLLMAIVFAVVAYVLTRNLPGLLEVLVLSKLQLGQGASYAITTMLSYVITALGVMLSLSAIGMSWDKLQWIATGLSVGLGFGLQEIFANFVAGLILLFERPIRIGDTITIGNFTGTVSKIRIRATTVTDFDRKEVIIPNKNFVVERLQNWSLSDTVTRVLIRVGVAYGSDLDLTRQLLLQAAHENERVMKDPEPLVFFLTFGASTLDHELRVYVRELRDRSFTVDELNRRIDHLFRENNIEIAFNQMDIYVKNLNTPTEDEVKVHSTTQVLPPKLAE